MQRKHWLICRSNHDKNWEFLLSPKLKGNACTISLILQCKGILSGWALIGLNISQKNVLSRHPLLPGHQGHPGGLRPPGLRTGMSTIGKTVRRPKNGKMRRHRLTFSMKSIQAPGNWLSLASNDKSEVVKHQLQSLTAVLTLFYRLPTIEKPQLLICSCLIFWISRPDSGNCLVSDGECRQYTWPDAQTHIFLVERVTFHSCALCMAQDVSRWKESASSFCAHFHLVRWCRCWTFLTVLSHKSYPHQAAHCPDLQRLQHHGKKLQRARSLEWDVWPNG